MRKRLLVALLLAAVVASHAQNPGYLGKHFFLNADVVLSPAWRNPNPISTVISSEKKVNRWLGINYIVNPSVEYVVGKKSAVGVGYNFYQTPFSNSDDDIFLSHLWNDLDYKMQSHGFSVFYKHYLGTSYAPFGHYIKAQLDGFFNYYCPYTDSLNWQSTQLLNPEDPHRGHSVLLGAKAEYGFEYLFFNRLRLSTGVSLGTTFGGYGVLYKRIKDETSYFYDPANAPTVKERANARLLMAYFFGIRFGIDVLLF